jgi:glutaredoxin
MPALLLAALAFTFGGPACSHKHDDGTAPAAAGKELPPLTIKDDSPDLLLTWIDDKGDTHVELKPADVPAAARGFVRVVVSDRDDGTRDLFYVVDLGKKRDDGTYVATTLRRRDWEAELEKRREAALAKVAPRPAQTGAEPNPPPGQVQAAGVVVIYGASWCGPCHEAADYLKRKGIPYVMKDVEQTPGAAAEMQEKLARVGRRGGSIPVIDVRGQILVGFSAAAIDQALRHAPATTL